MCPSSHRLIVLNESALLVKCPKTKVVACSTRFQVFFPFLKLHVILLWWSHYPGSHLRSQTNIHLPWKLKNKKFWLTINFFRAKRNIAWSRKHFKRTFVFAQKTVVVAIYRTFPLFKDWGSIEFLVIAGWTNYISPTQSWYGSGCSFEELVQGSWDYMIGDVDLSVLCHFYGQTGQTA